MSGLLTPQELEVAAVELVRLKGPSFSLEGARLQILQLQDLYQAISFAKGVTTNSPKG